MKQFDLFINIDKSDYTDLINIDNTNENYYKVAFISDGSGIITRGRLYVNSPYWIEVVDEIPEQQQQNTIYLIKE